MKRIAIFIFLKITEIGLVGGLLYGWYKLAEGLSWFTINRSSPDFHGILLSMMMVLIGALFIFCIGVLAYVWIIKNWEVAGDIEKNMNEDVI